MAEFDNKPYTISYQSAVVIIAFLVLFSSY